LLHKFPRIEALVIVADLPGCADVVKEAKSINPAMSVIALSATLPARCANADYLISTHEPEALVELLRSVFGDPRKAA